MNNFTVFQSLYDQLQGQLLAGIAAQVAAFSNYARAPIQAALILYIAVSGFMLVLGHGGSVGAIVQKLLKLCLVAWFATDATAYTTWVSDFFLTQLPDDLTQAIVQGNGGRVATSAGAFDILWRQSWMAGLSVWQRYSFTDVGEEFVIVVFWVAAMISVAISFAIWIISKIVLALFIIVGPLMIALPLFGATREIFSRWIGALISSVLLQVGILILLSLTVRVTAGLIVQTMSNPAANNYEQLGMLCCLIIVFLVSGILSIQMPSWASSLAGGMQFHGGAVAYLLLTQMRGARSVAGAAASGTGAAIGKGATAIRKGIARPAQQAMKFKGGR